MILTNTYLGEMLLVLSWVLPLFLSGCPLVLPCHVWEKTSCTVHCLPIRAASSTHRKAKYFYYLFFYFFIFSCEAYSYDEGFLYLRHKEMHRGGEKKRFVINTRLWGLLGKPASSLPFPGGFELRSKPHLTQCYKPHKYNNVPPPDVCSVPDKWSSLLATWKVGGPGCVLNLVPWMIFCWVVEGWLCKNRRVIFHCWHL